VEHDKGLRVGRGIKLDSRYQTFCSWTYLFLTDLNGQNGLCLSFQLACEIAIEIAIVIASRQQSLSLPLFPMVQLFG
jgi:hypothetical protein